MEEKYKYANLELTPSVFKDLLIKFYDGKQFDRQTAITTILDFHKKNGGIFKEGKNIVAVFKHATRLLRECGIENLGYATWKLNYKIPTLEVAEKKNDDEINISADKTIGEGDKYVYVYYYDSYRLLAQLQGKHIWPCKIGRTDTEPLQRVMGQSGTCFPENPHVALVINCHDSAKLEAAIHAIFKLKERHLITAPGTEWFLTSPEEVEEIFTKIL